MVGYPEPLRYSFLSDIVKNRQVESLLNREFNTKCLIISGGVVGAYYVLPPDNLWAAVGLGFGSYIGIAWYDHHFQCEDRLTSYDSIFTTVTKPFKPPVGPDMKYS